MSILNIWEILVLIFWLFIIALIISFVVFLKTKLEAYDQEYRKFYKQQK
jgi:hypothetical protein